MARPNISAGYFRSGLPFNRFGEGARIAVIFQGLQFEHKPLERDVLAFLMEGDRPSSDAERDTVATSTPERRT